MGQGDNLCVKKNFLSKLHSHRQMYFDAIPLEAISNVQSHVKRQQLKNVKSSSLRLVLKSHYSPQISLQFSICNKLV